MTVAENVEYGLRVKGVKRAERARAVDDVLATVRLEGYGGRKPVQLSGGQRQRVALARAIVNRPKVLLLDEPLGALDLKLRHEMQGFLKALQRDLAMTFVYVTHDQEEALTMSTRVAVFSHGRIEQVGTPTAIYERPETEFVAELRRHVEHPRARRAPALPASRADRVRERGRARDRGRGGVRRCVHTLRRGHRPGRAARRPTTERRLDARARHAGQPRVACRGRVRAFPRTRSPGGHMSKRTWAVFLVLVAALAVPAAGVSKSNGGTLNMIAWEGYTQPQWVKPFEKSERLQGQREVRRLVGRDGHADALGRRRPVRHGLGLRRREPPPHLRRRRTDDRPLEDPGLQELHEDVPVAAEQHGRRQALRHLAAVGPEHAPLQHAEGEARARPRGARSTARSTRARSPFRTTRSRSRTRRCT